MSFNMFSYFAENYLYIFYIILINISIILLFLVLA